MGTDSAHYAPLEKSLQQTCFQSLESSFYDFDTYRSLRKATSDVHCTITGVTLAKLSHALSPAWVSAAPPTT